MKKITAISLLFIFLSANTELHQLMKLPVLIHHFLEHKNQEHNETLAEFLVEHYAEKPNHCNDNHNDHENLPFKTNDCATVHSSIAFNTQTVFSLVEPITFSSKISIPKNIMFVPSAFLCNIWQPPKIS